MGNLFANLPAPAGNGVGAAVDLSAYGEIKTFIVDGTWVIPPSITVEMNDDAGQDGDWIAVTPTFQGAGVVTVSVVGKWFRVNVGNFFSGVAPQVNVGGTDGGTTIISLPSPVDNGVGAAVDVSALGSFKTTAVQGPFKGFVVIELSTDGATEWAQNLSFKDTGQQSTVVVANWARVRRQGIPSNVSDVGLPIVNIGAANPGDGAAVTVEDNGTPVVSTQVLDFRGGVTVTDVGGVARITVNVGGIAVEDEGTPLPANPYSTLNFVGGGVAAGDVGGVATVAIPGLVVDKAAVPIVSPAITLNFTGPAVTVTDAGGGRADVDIQGTPEIVGATNHEATTVVAGAPVYISSNLGFLKARADSSATGPVIGLVLADIAASATGNIQTSGPIILTTAQWDAVCGTTGGLSFNVPYYLDATTAGKLTATPPSAVGQVVQQVIIGVSTTEAVIAIGPATVNGSASNLITLLNASGGGMIIGEPIYSIAAAQMSLGIANGSGKSIIQGLVADAAIGNGASGKVCVGGLMVATTAQWDAVCGTTGGLTFNTPYYLDPATPGRLTATAPSAAGQEVVQVITALSTTLARVAITSPILL